MNCLFQIPVTNKILNPLSGIFSEQGNPKKQSFGEIPHNKLGKMSTQQIQMGQCSEEIRRDSGGVSRMNPGGILRNEVSEGLPCDNSDKRKKSKHAYWQYGNRGFKIKNFNKKMSRNLAIMYYVDRVFCEFVETSFNNSYKSLFKSSSNLEYQLKSGTITTVDKVVRVSLNKNKINDCFFTVLNAGYTTISDVNITEKDLLKNKVPSFASVVEHIDNIAHVSKLARIFSLALKFTVNNNTSGLESNQSRQNSPELYSEEIPSGLVRFQSRQNSPELYSEEIPPGLESNQSRQNSPGQSSREIHLDSGRVNPTNPGDNEFNFNNFTLNGMNIINDYLDNDKKKILKSDSNSGFYIKMYSDHGKAFFMDAENNLMYYISQSEDSTKNIITIRYYLFSTEKCKIVKEPC